MKDSKDDDIDDTTAPLIEHLTELRSRLIYSVLAFAVCMLFCFTVARPIFNFLAVPLATCSTAQGQKPELIFTGLQQGFMTQVRISVFGGFVIAFPIIAYQLWRFVAPGLYRQEKRAFLPFLLASPILFLLGAAFAYYVILPMAFHFFLGFQQFGADVPAPGPAGEVTPGEVSIQFLGTINEYLGLTMKFIIAFGLCFQLPVLLTLMGKVELVTAQGLGRMRKYAIVGILTLAAVVTPPDVVSQVVLFSVVYSLYEISILLVRMVERQREADLRAQGLWDEADRRRRREQGRPVSDADRGALARIAEALERISPPPQPAPDLDRRRGLRLAHRPRPARAGAAGGPRRDRPPGRHRPRPRHAAGQHPPVRPRLPGQQRAALGRPRHGQVEPGQGRARRGRRRDAPASS